MKKKTERREERREKTKQNTKRLPCKNFILVKTPTHALCGIMDVEKKTSRNPISKEPGTTWWLLQATFNLSTTWMFWQLVLFAVWSWCPRCPEAALLSEDNNKIRRAGVITYSGVFISTALPRSPLVCPCQQCSKLITSPPIFILPLWQIVVGWRLW